MEFLSHAVYDTLWGVLAEEHRIEGVPDLFAPDSVCAKHYEQALAACLRLSERLGVVNEDVDVEQIMNAMLAICREVGIHMFECGKRMA